MAGNYPISPIQHMAIFKWIGQYDFGCLAHQINTQSLEPERPSSQSWFFGLLVVNLGKSHSTTLGLSILIFKMVTKITNVH